MGRKVRLSALAESAVEDVPGHSAPTLIRLRPAQIAATPLNPRENFGTPDELTELGESMRVRQLQPVVAVSSSAYLKLWPDHKEHIGSADYVLVNGERRYRSALHVRLDTLDALIRDEVADSRAAFLDALVSENIDRKNFDPIEEAIAVEAMVQECGSAKLAAERFRKHESWISQRRALLRLTPEIQARVRTGDVPVRIARSLASFSPEQQEAALLTAQADQANQTRKQATRKRARSGEVEDAASIRPGPDSEAFTAVKTGRAEAPWHSPETLADLIRQRLTPDQVKILISLLGETDAS
jgi:ParB family transcriptional regulator, chromosome partitioning protein